MVTVGRALCALWMQEDLYSQVESNLGRHGGRRETKGVAKEFIVIPEEEVGPCIACTGLVKCPVLCLR